MLKHLALAAGKSLGHQQGAASAAAPVQTFARLISRSHGSAAGAGDRGEGAAATSERGVQGEPRARKMGESVEPKVHDAFDISPGGANASPDLDSAGRVGGMDMGKVVDAVGGMVHGDRSRTERAVGSMSSESAARPASQGVAQTTSTRWPRSMETTANGDSSQPDRPRPMPARGDQGAPLSSGYGNQASSGAVDRDGAPHRMHMPSDAPNTGPVGGTGAVPGYGDGGPSGQQYNRLANPSAPEVEENLSMDAGTEHDEANKTYDTAEGGKDINSPGGGRQP